MPTPRAKMPFILNWFVLAITLSLSLLARPVVAAPNFGAGLQNGEFPKGDFAKSDFAEIASTLMASPKSAAQLATSLLYNARVAFVLYSESSKDRDQVLSALLSDRSQLSLKALAEIASATKDKSVRFACLEKLVGALPSSAPSLRYIARYGSTKALRVQASKAAGLKQLAGSKSSNPSTTDEDLSSESNSLFATAGELKLLERLLSGAKTGGRIAELETVLTAPESLENGSRYAIQSHFLTRVLALQTASEEERLSRFDALLNEIEAFLHKRTRVLKITTPAQFEAFKATLVSRYSTLSDDIKFSSGLRDRSPVKLKISSEVTSSARSLSDASHSIDMKLPEPYQGFFFDFLSSDSPQGFLFRLQLKSLPAAQKAKLLDRISTEFKSRHESLKTVAQEMMASGAIQFEDPAEQRFLELMIETYFSAFSFEETANIMKAGFERPDFLTGNDRFRLFVMYAGPQMQKLFQVVARRPELSKELAKTFQALEDAGLKSPWEVMAPKFAKPPVGYDWVSLSEKAFVGTMAETYAGVVRNKETGETTKIAARALKDKIRDRFDSEIPRLIRLGKVLDTDPMLRELHFAKVGPVLDDVMSMSEAELDPRLTIDNQKTGERVYTTSMSFGSGRKLHFITAKTLQAENPEVIYSTWLEGEKFESFRVRDPERAVKVAEATAKHWLEQALFNERFFHADLHQGNIKVRESQNGDITVGLLDFGMVGKIEKAERSVLIRLGLATKQNTNPTLIAKYLFAMSDRSENQISEADLVTQARAHMNSKRNSGKMAELSLDKWMEWGMSVGLKLPKKITAFGRGIGTVEQLMIGTGSKHEIVDLMKRVALKHAIELTPDLVKYLRDFTVAAVQERRAVRSENKSLEARAQVQPSLSRQGGFRCEAVFAH